MCVAEHETYRSFRDTAQPAHELFADPDWARTLVSLHSFSKDPRFAWEDTYTRNEWLDQLPTHRATSTCSRRTSWQQYCRASAPL